MTSSGYHIPCHFPSAGGRTRASMLKKERHHALCFRKSGFFGERFAQSLNQRQPSHMRCSEKPNGDLEDKYGSENLSQVDEYTLEAKLQAAIQSENYGTAAQLRDQLRALQEDSRAAVRAANAKFYKAFEMGDLKVMRSIWARGDNAHCIHPGAGRISGYDMVIASWELMLGQDISLPLKIELHNLEVQVKGNMGYVTCLEVVRTSGSSWGKQLATNIFEKQNGIWYLCMHHASHITL
eukprot:c19256_g1_i1 orf=361-1074(-)